MNQRLNPLDENSLYQTRMSTLGASPTIDPARVPGGSPSFDVEQTRTGMVRTVDHFGRPIWLRPKTERAEAPPVSPLREQHGRNQQQLNVLKKTIALLEQRLVDVLAPSKPPSLEKEEAQSVFTDDEWFERRNEHGGGHDSACEAIAWGRGIERALINATARLNSITDRLQV